MQLSCARSFCYNTKRPKSHLSPSWRKKHLIPEGYVSSLRCFPNRL
jgi:hypothetical protein